MRALPVLLAACVYVLPIAAQETPTSARAEDLKALDVFVGRWTITGEISEGSVPVQYAGTEDCEWFGGAAAHLLCQARYDDGVRTMLLFWHDGTVGRVRALLITTQGTTFTFEVVREGNVLTSLARTDTGRVRVRITVTDQDEHTMIAEHSADGVNWKVVDRSTARRSR